MSYKCEHGKDSDICVQCWEEKNLESKIVNEQTELNKLKVICIHPMLMQDEIKNKQTKLQMAIERVALGTRYDTNIATEDIELVLSAAKQLETLQNENEMLRRANEQLILTEQSIRNEANRLRRETGVLDRKISELEGRIANALL